MKKVFFCAFIFSMLVSATIVFGTTHNTNAKGISGFICATQDGRIVLLNEAADGENPIYYFLQVDKIPTKIGRKLVNATLDVHESYIFIQNGDGEKLLFHLSNSKLTEQLTAIDAKVSGFGLGNSGIDGSAYAKIIKKLTSDGVDIVVDFPPVRCLCQSSGGGSCSSGGPGSSSCSRSNTLTGDACSVTCGSGYYACCN